MAKEVRCPGRVEMTPPKATYLRAAPIYNVLQAPEICFSCTCIESGTSMTSAAMRLRRPAAERSKGMRTGEPPSTGRVERTASAYSLTQVAEYLIT